MRQVACPGVGAVSALGFGCASLGSRISERTGRAAIDRALEAGITWFDVAPSYGDGNAERILGLALAGTTAEIATKVGIVAPPSGGANRLAGMLARPLINAVPALRPLAKSLRGPAAAAIALSPETIRTSLSRSLDRLRRDHVAMLALHGPSLEDVRRDEIIRTLTDLKSEGLAKTIGIAGSVEAFNAACAAGLPATIAQIANDPFDRAVTRLTAGPFTITHSVFGVAGSLARLEALMRRPDAQQHCRALGYDDPAQLLLDYAFAANPNGTVIASSYKPPHLTANASAASAPPSPALVTEIEALLRTH